VAQGLDDVFAVQLCLDTGNLWMGGYDSTYYSGQLLWLPMQPSFFYSVNLQYILFGNNNISGNFGEVVVDSGTSIIELPTPLYNLAISLITSDSYFSNLFGSDFYDQPNCLSGPTPQELNSQLPKLKFAFPEGNLATDAVNSYLLHLFDDGVDYYCQGIIEAGNEDYIQTILGYPFMSQFITVFDRRKQMVGFAPSILCDSSGGTTSNTPVSTNTGDISSHLTASATTLKMVSMELLFAIAILLLHKL